MAKKTPDRGSRIGTLMGPRTLSMMVPSYYAAKTATGWPTKNDSSTSTWGKGWQSTSTKGIYYETYMDLSGYELDDMTFFPIESGFQDPGLYSGVTAARPGPNMWVMDIMSQERLDGNTLTKMLDNTLNEFNNAPGMMGSDINYHEITMGNLRVLGATTQVTSSTVLPFIVQNGSPFGSGEPIVVQKLWCYRFVHFDAAAGDTLSVPASRFVLVGNAQKEADLVYMQRLKNSYENQGSV